MPAQANPDDNSDFVPTVPGNIGAPAPTSTPAPLAKLKLLSYISKSFALSDFTSEELEQLKNLLDSLKLIEVLGFDIGAWDNEIKWLDAKIERLDAQVEYCDTFTKTLGIQPLDARDVDPAVKYKIDEVRDPCQACLPCLPC